MESEKKPVTEENHSKFGLPKLQQLPVAWIVAGVIFVILLVGAVMLGLQTEHRYGDAVLNVLPKNITAKWGSSSPKVVEEKKAEIASVISKKTDPIISPTVSTSSPTVIVTPPPDGGVTDSGFILPFSNTRRVVETDLMGLTPWDLKVARNEIYARHGRPFVHKDLSCYFAKQKWYSVDPVYDDKSLSTIEVSNAAFILSFENSINSPLVNKDSGCK